VTVYEQKVIQQLRQRARKTGHWESSRALMIEAAALLENVINERDGAVATTEQED